MIPPEPDVQSSDLLLLCYAKVIDVALPFPSGIFRFSCVLVEG